MILVGLLAEAIGGVWNTTPFQHDIPSCDKRTDGTDNPDIGRHAASVCFGLQGALRRAIGAHRILVQQ